MCTSMLFFTYWLYVGKKKKNDEKIDLEYLELRQFG